MKISLVIAAGIGIIILVLSVVILSNFEDKSNVNTVRVAFFPNIGHAIPIVGLENKIFEENLGSETSIQPRIFYSGPQVTESLFSKSIDLAYVGPGPAINGFVKSEKHDIVILSGAASGGASFVVHPNSTINKAEDFNGKKIGTPQIGNSQDVSLRNFLSEHGLKTFEKGGTVVILNIANPDIYTLFSKHQIDAAWVPEPWATILVQELNGKRLFYEEELWPDNTFASVLLIGRQEFVEKHPEIVRLWLESHNQTAIWIQNNPEETRTVFNNFLQNQIGQTLSDSIVDESLANLEITTNPMKDSIYIFAERADSLGYLGRGEYSLDGIFFDLTSKEEIEETK